MKKSGKGVGRFQKSAVSLRKTMLGLGGAFVGFVGVRALIGKFNQTRNSIDEIAKSSRKLQVTTEILSALRFAGEQTGFAFGGMTKAIQRMRSGIGEALGGTGEAKQAFDKLGLSAKGLANARVDQQLMAIAEAMKQVENASQRVTFAEDIFGGRGAGILNLLEGGAEGIRKLGSEAVELGLIVDQKQAEKIEKFNDTLNKISKFFEGKFFEIVTSNADRLISVAESILVTIQNTAKHGPLAGRQISRLGQRAFANGGEGLAIDVFGKRLNELTNKQTVILEAMLKEMTKETGVRKQEGGRL